jgi:RNA polymerase sigma-70 factor (ECF subfamily)
MKGYDLNDYQAIQRLKRGDISGLKTLVERYQVKAARTAYLITRDLASADDVMQAAFLRAYKSISSFDLNRPFEPWLMRIVVNLALKMVTVMPDGVADEVIEDIAIDAEADPALVVEDQELETLVRGALDQLPPKQRAVIVLYYYLDYSETDIATALERPLGTVRWQLHTAKKLLKTLLRKGVES